MVNGEGIHDVDCIFHCVCRFFRVSISALSILAAFYHLFNTQWHICRNIVHFCVHCIFWYFWVCEKKGLKTIKNRSRKYRSCIIFGLILFFSAFLLITSSGVWSWYKSFISLLNLTS